MLSLSRTTSVLRTLYRNCNVRNVQRTARVCCQKKDAADFYDDFFGIEYDTLTEKKLSPSPPAFIVNQPDSQERVQSSAEEPSDWTLDSDQVLQMNFGTIRLDSMNETGGSRRSKPRISSTSEVDLGYIDAQYFSEVTREAMDRFAETEGKRKDRELNASNQTPIEETAEMEPPVRGTESDQSVQRNFVSTQSRDDLNYFDEVLLNQEAEEMPFGEKPIPYETDTFPKIAESTSRKREATTTTTAGTDFKPFESSSKRLETKQTEYGIAPSIEVTPVKSSSKRFENRAENITAPGTGVTEVNRSPKSLDNPSETGNRTHPVHTTTAKNDVGEEMPKTAFELSREIRAEEGESRNTLDSKGFLNPKSQVEDLSRETRDDLVTRLRRSVLYDDHDILAIDKPYGLSTQDGTGVRNSIDSLLPRLAASLAKDSTLYQVHRLDKNTTGVMLFAKTAEMQKRLIDLFRRHRIRKRYWVLTKGVPSPRSGVIDIPMVEASVEGMYRMILAPDDPKIRLIGKKTSQSSSRAVTKYTVLDSNNSVALVECEPITGLKHQVRCHLGYGIDCPILGDHKYSHQLKRLPQKLYPETLQRLGIRQAKVRHLPLHLHSSSVYIPEVAEGKNVFIKSRLPEHFMDNMRKLKIKPERK